MKEKAETFWAVALVLLVARRDKAWHLVRVSNASFHAFSPEDVKRSVYRPPRDFGKIDFQDFDPNDFQGKGKR